METPVLDGWYPRLAVHHCESCFSTFNAGRASPRQSSSPRSMRCADSQSPSPCSARVEHIVRVDVSPIWRATSERAEDFPLAPLSTRFLEQGVDRVPGRTI